MSYIIAASGLGGAGCFSFRVEKFIESAGPTAVMAVKVVMLCFWQLPGFPLCLN
jgi:hypothetical protein